MDRNDFLTVKEVAESLGISRYQVYRRIVRGDLKATEARQGNVHYLISTQALADYIAAGGGDVLSPPRHPDATLLRVSQVALETGFSAESIRQMCIEGRISYTRGRGPKGHYRIPRSAVDDLLAGTWR